jgi:hypothetical protein
MTDAQRMWMLAKETGFSLIVDRGDCKFLLIPVKGYLAANDKTEVPEADLLVVLKMPFSLARIGRPSVFISDLTPDEMMPSWIAGQLSLMSALEGRWGARPQMSAAEVTGIVLGLIKELNGVVS